MPPGDERGSVLILGVGVVVVAVAAFLVAVDLSLLGLTRTQADSAADAAARAAAQSLDLGRYYVGEPGRELPLALGQARVRASRVLDMPWRLEEVSLRDGAVVVVVSRRVTLATAALFGRSPVVVRASAAAALQRSG